MTEQDSKVAFTAYYPRQTTILGALFTAIIAVGAWLFSDWPSWLHVAVIFVCLSCILCLATARTFVLAGGKLYRGKARAKTAVDLAVVKTASFSPSPSWLIHDDLIHLVMDRKLHAKFDGYSLALGNFRSSAAAKFTAEIEEAVRRARPPE